MKTSESLQSGKIREAAIAESKRVREIAERKGIKWKDIYLEY